MALFKSKKKDKPKVDTFSKVWVNRMLIHSWICIYLCFILAFLGREQIAESLACAIVASIVGIMAPYFAKSFFETREERKNQTQSINIEEPVSPTEPVDEDEEFLDC